MIYGSNIFFLFIYHYIFHYTLLFFFHYRSKRLELLTSVLAKKVHSSDQVAVNIFPSTSDSLKLGLFSALQL